MGFLDYVLRSIGSRPSELPADPPQPSPTKQRFLDLDAQPNPAFNRDMRLDRAVTEMLGLARGILADGVVTEPEVHALADWLEANSEVAGVWPVRPVADRLQRIFADGIVEPHEQEDLAELLRELLGGHDYGIMGGHSVGTALPLDRPAPQLEFDGRLFVFTGKFAFGPRLECERAVRELGGACKSSITLEVAYLVIGTFGSRDWIQTAYGRKIEKAVEYKARGAGIRIVAEDHWAAELP